MVLDSDQEEQTAQNQQVQKLQRSLRLLRACNSALVRAKAELELLQTLCQRIVDTGDYRFAWVACVEQDEGKTVQPLAAAGYEANYLQTIRITWANTEQGGGPVGRAVRTKQPCVVQDLQTDPNFQPWRAAAQQRGYRGAIALPLIDDDRVFGTLNIYTAEIDTFQAEEVELLTELAADLSYGVRALRQEQGRQQAEAELQAKRYILLAKNSPVGVFHTNAMGECTYVNDRWSQISGLSLAQAQGNGWVTGLHPEDYARISVEWAQATQEKRPFQLEYRFQRSDGSISWVLGQAVAELDADGQVTGHIGTITDISDLKQAEEERWQAQQIRNELTLLESILDTTLAGYWDWDIVKNQEYLSPGFKRMFGYEDAELPNVPESWMGLIFAEDLPEVFERLDRHMQSKGQIPYYHEVRYRHKNGDTVWIMCSGRVIEWDNAGNPLRMVGCHIDITDRKQAEMQLQATNENLLHATRLKNEFLANMSHELRTPLNAILGMTEGLQDEIFGSINPKQSKSLKTIERNGSHLLALINDILDVAKIESGKIQLSCNPTNINDLFLSSLDVVEQHALQKKIRLKLEMPTNLPDLLVDERRIHQVLINLLSNAVKFTNEGGCVTLRAEHSADSLPPNYLRISVVDTGIGIAPESFSKLFQPFVQIDGALNRQHNGTGLGLALVKHIIELHGSQVKLVSEVGVGSCFSFDLPSTVQPSDQHDAPTQIGAAIGQSATATSPLILLAEDNEDNINLVASYLEASGYRLVLAKNGREAIALARSEQPDLVLMDVQMPVMDGIEALREMRRDPDLAVLPIVVLTALAMSGDRERCLAAGADEYMSKPVKLRELLVTIQKSLGKMPSKRAE